ncbi:MAG: hypothetical protein WKH97_06720 [Casimicrobiaceae bacterium]
MKVSVKVVGASGQISLGKEFAGRQVLIEEAAPGVWIVRTATVIPDNERWLHTPEVAGGLSRALAWAAENPAQPTDLTAFRKRLEHDEERPSCEQRARGRGRSQQSRVSKKLVLA